MSIRAEYASKVLHAFVTSGAQPPTGAPKKKSKYSDEQRSAHARKLRDAMHEILDKGGRPEGPKADWIREASGHVIQLLEEIAEQYNSEHDEDACIGGDILDVLATVRAHFVE